MNNQYNQEILATQADTSVEFAGGGGNCVLGAIECVTFDLDASVSLHRINLERCALPHVCRRDQQ